MSRTRLHTKEHADLVDALDSILAWIEVWQPEFFDVPAWQDIESRARAALKAAKGTP